MTDRSRVAGICTVTEELLGALFAATTMLTRVGITTVHHLARVKHDLVFAAEFILLPIGG
jgi:hypothetical protein